jgi:hypothetical protein
VVSLAAAVRFGGFLQAIAAGLEFDGVNGSPTYRDDRGLSGEAISASL